MTTPEFLRDYMWSKERVHAGIRNRVALFDSGRDLERQATHEYDELRGTDLPPMMTFPAYRRPLVLQACSCGGPQSRRGHHTSAHRAIQGAWSRRASRGQQDLLPPHQGHGQLLRDMAELGWALEVAPELCIRVPRGPQEQELVGGP